MSKSRSLMLAMVFGTVVTLLGCVEAYAGNFNVVVYSSGGQRVYVGTLSIAVTDANNKLVANPPNSNTGAFLFQASPSVGCTHQALTFIITDIVNPSHTLTVTGFNGANNTVQNIYLIME